MSSTVTTVIRPRRTQEERTRQTRARLLDATIDCLVEAGYKGTTVARVARRAGTSAGAQQHHFPTKAELVTAAVEHLAEARMAAIRDRVSELDGSALEGAVAALDLTWEALSGWLNVATRELWLAARTDPALLAVLVPAERRTGRALRELFADVLDPDPQVATALELCIDAMRGLALRSVLLGEAETAAMWQRYRPLVLDLLVLPDGV